MHTADRVASRFLSSLAGCSMPQRQTAMCLLAACCAGLGVSTVGWAASRRRLSVSPSSVSAAVSRRVLLE